MKFLFIFAIIISFSSVYSFYGDKSGIIDEKPFFQAVLDDNTIYKKNILKKRYLFVSRLIEERKYLDAVREISDIKYDFSGKSMQYMDFLLGKLYLVLGTNGYTNDTVIYKYIHSNGVTGTMLTNYYEYMVSELIDLYNGEQVTPDDLRFLVNTGRRTYYINALKRFESVISNRQTVEPLRAKAILGKAEVLLFLDEVDIAEKELIYFLEYYPVSKLRMDGYYMMSRTFVRREDYAKAIAWLLRILHDYPVGEHVPIVKLKILILNEIRSASSYEDYVIALEKYEHELNVRNELNDYFGALLDKINKRN